MTGVSVLYREFDGWLFGNIGGSVYGWFDYLAEDLWRL